MPTSDAPSSDMNNNAAILTSNFYDVRWAQIGVQMTHDRILRSRFIIKALEFIRKSTHMASIKQPLRILDLGCGNGWMALILYKYGDVVGLDFSPNAIKMANEHLGQYGTFLLADPEHPHLGIGDNKKFDIVVCSEVIEHTVDQIALLAQINGLLKDDGWCIFTTPNGNVWDEYKMIYRGELQPIENWLTTSQCSALFEESGLKILWHLGGIHPRLKFGRVKWFQGEKVRVLFEKLSLDYLYSKAILGLSLYQFVLAIKRKV